MGLKVTGDRLLRKSFATMGRDVNMAGRAALRRGAQEMQKVARDLAPIEYGNLERAIEIEEKHLDTNSWQQTLFVNPNISASERNGPGRTVRVGKYAKYVEDGIPSGIGKSETSREKAAMLGTRVGPGFMRRAMNKMLPKVKRDVEAAIQAAIERKEGVTTRDQAAVRQRAIAKKNIAMVKKNKASKSKPKTARNKRTNKATKRRGK